MFARLRNFKALLEEIRLAKDTSLDKEGRRMVRIGLSSDCEFLSPLSPNAEPFITADTAQFLEHSTKHLRPDSKLHFVFEGASLTPDERDRYTKAIRNYYHSEFAEVARDLHKNTVQTISMVAVSAVVFALNIFLKSNGVDQVLYNIIDIVAWVFAWEATDIFFLQRPAMRLRRLRLFNIIQAAITFE